MNSTGRTLNNIVRQVGDLAELVGNIAEATQTQAGRLGAVNLASNKLDAITRDNTRLAVECNGAIETLQRQADELAAIVSQFALTAPATTAPMWRARRFI